MEHNSDPTPGQPDDQVENKGKGIVRLIIKLIIGAIIVFFAAVALVFGACLLG